MRFAFIAVVLLALLGWAAPTTASAAAAGASPPATSAAQPNARAAAAAPVIEGIYEDRAADDFADVGTVDSAPGRRLAEELDKAVGILAADDMPNIRVEMKGSFDVIAEKQQEIAGWRVAMAYAPDGPGQAWREGVKKWTGVSVVPLTTGDYEALIADAQGDVKAQDAAIDKVKRRFADRLRRMGIAVTDEQVDGLMLMATADDFLQMQAAFENMKAINNQLLAATIRSDESLEVAKRYYGIYTVMLEIAGEMHMEFLRKVDDDYLAKLDGIAGKTQALRAQAVKLEASESDPNLRKVLEANVSAQDLTLRTAALYRSQLLDQRGKVEASLAVLESQHAVAANTWRTVGISSDLVTLVRSTGKEFDAIMHIDVPPLRPFESVKMKREFEKLTSEIKSSTP